MQCNSEILPRKPPPTQLGGAKLGTLLCKASLPTLGDIDIIEPDSRDAEKLNQFFQSLSEETIVMRFLRPLRDFTSIVKTITSKEETIVATAATYKGMIIGTAEVYRTANPHTGEFAIVVHDSYRRRGVGTTLMLVALYCAYMRGCKRILAYTHENNIPMKKLAKKFDGKISGMLDEETYIIEFTLPKSLDPGIKAIRTKSIEVNPLPPHCNTASRL